MREKQRWSGGESKRLCFGQESREQICGGLRRELVTDRGEVLNAAISGDTYHRSCRRRIAELLGISRQCGTRRFRIVAAAVAVAGSTYCGYETERVRYEVTRDTNWEGCCLPKPNTAEMLWAVFGEQPEPDLPSANRSEGDAETSAWRTKILTASGKPRETRSRMLHLAIQPKKMSNPHKFGASQA